MKIAIPFDDTIRQIDNFTKGWATKTIEAFYEGGLRCLIEDCVLEKCTTYPRTRSLPFDAEEWAKSTLSTIVTSAFEAWTHNHDLSYEENASLYRLNITKIIIMSDELDKLIINKLSGTIGKEHKGRKIAGTEWHDGDILVLEFD